MTNKYYIKINNKKETYDVYKGSVLGKQIIAEKYLESYEEPMNAETVCILLEANILKN